MIKDTLKKSVDDIMSCSCNAKEKALALLTLFNDGFNLVDGIEKEMFLICEMTKLIKVSRDSGHYLKIIRMRNEMDELSLAKNSWQKNFNR